MGIIGFILKQDLVYSMQQLQAVEPQSQKTRYLRSTVY
jgi:hypothetical protein